MRLKGKISLVTGATTGIGAEIAREFARQGSHVIMLARREALLHEQEEQIQAHGGTCASIVCDIGDSAQIRRAFAWVAETYGGLDVLVNNAAIQLYGTAENHEEEAFDEVIRCNLKGTFLCTQQAIPLMKARGKGSIIQMGSVTGIHGHPGLIAYTATKGGIHAMARAAAIELAKDQIRVNVVAPATIQTPILDRHIAATKDPLATKAAFDSIHPMGSVGQPIDVAMACVYLASDDAKWVTGTTLEVDGGYLNQGQLPGD